MFCKVQHKSELSVRMFNYICIYQTVQLKSKLQNNGTWLVSVWPPCHLCYHPAVFSCHFHLIAISSPPLQKKIGAYFKSVIFFHLKNSISLKLRNLKPHELGGCLYNSDVILKPCNYVSVSSQIYFLCILHSWIITIYGITDTAVFTSEHSFCEYG